MKISFSPAGLPKSGVLILLVSEAQPLAGLAAEADRLRRFAATPRGYAYCLCTVE